ncbi:MAG: polysaccharide pyruvyl transferase family protein [Rhodospirillaceae bacterium]
MQVIYTSARKPRPSVPFHIVLYALIPQDRAYRPIPRSPLLFVRNRLRRWAELLSWRFLGRWRAHYSTFKDRDNTNRGDIAIRMGVKRQLERAFENHEITITDLPWGSLAMALKVTPAPDLVVIAGGGFLFADRDGRLPQRFKDDVKVLEKLSCPVAVCAVGLNRLIEDSDQKIFRFHPESRADVRRFLSRATLASVRDETTRRALGSVDRRSLPVIVDPGFLVAEPPATVRTPDPRRPLEVGINMAFHGAHTSRTSRWMLPLMLRIVKRLRDEAGCRFTYFVHSDGEAGLASALKLAGVPLDIVHADVDDMMAAYRRMDIHIGQMLHSAILAMSVGTPALSLAYDVKSAGFYNLLGLDELCLDAVAASEDEIMSSAKALIECRHAVARTLRARRAALEAESKDFYAQVAALVAPYRSGRLPALHPADRARSVGRSTSH